MFSYFPYFDYRSTRSAKDAHKKRWVPASKIKGIPASLIEEYVFTGDFHLCSEGRRVDFYDPRKVRCTFGLLTDDDIQSLKEDGYDDEDLEPFEDAVEDLKNYEKNRIRF
jgi:hypothetical protein